MLTRLSAHWGLNFLNQSRSSLIAAWKSVNCRIRHRQPIFYLHLWFSVVAGTSGVHICLAPSAARLIARTAAPLLALPYHHDGRGRGP